MLIFSIIGIILLAILIYGVTYQLALSIIGLTGIKILCLVLIVLSILSISKIIDYDRKHRNDDDIDDNQNQITKTKYPVKSHHQINIKQNKHKK